MGCTQTRVIWQTRVPSKWDFPHSACLCRPGHWSCFVFGRGLNWADIIDSLVLRCWAQIGTLLGWPGPQFADWRPWHISVCIIIWTSFSQKVSQSVCLPAPPSIYLFTYLPTYLPIFHHSSWVCFTGEPSITYHIFLFFFFKKKPYITSGLCFLFPLDGWERQFQFSSDITENPDLKSRNRLTIVWLILIVS